MIYLASPYSAQPNVNYQLVASFVARKRELAADRIYFSPIVYWHHIAYEYEMPIDAQYYWIFNRHMIDLSTSVEVLCLPGWEQSTGVDQEITYAHFIRKPVVLRSDWQ
jgi:hypothetical protein